VQNDGNKFFISAEPLLGDIAKEIRAVPWRRISLIIIGAQTGAGAVKPERNWVMRLIEKADKYKTQIFIKDNLYKIYPDLPYRRELPWKLHTKTAHAPLEIWHTELQRKGLQNKFPINEEAEAYLDYYNDGDSPQDALDTEFQHAD
jgi:hypothetical protein